MDSYEEEYYRAQYPNYDRIIVRTIRNGFFNETGELMKEWWEHFTELVRFKSAKGYSQKNQGMSTDNLAEPIQRFQVLSAKIVENPKKYVLYTIKIGKAGHVSDLCVIERRYTEFLELYTKLQEEFPAIFMAFPFPKKEVFNNFSDELILFRRDRFESLLQLIDHHEKVKESSSVLEFFQKKERNEILIGLTVPNTEVAVLLEVNFRLLNALYSDRHPKVLQVLCLLVALNETLGQSTRALHFAQTAVRRFEGVSDTDSLRYYVPLLQLSVKLLREADTLSDSDALQERLDCMKRRGIKVDGCPSLLDVVMPDYTSPGLSL